MDIFIKGNRKYLITCSCAFAGCLLMITNSPLAVNAAKKAIGLWLTDVVPAMLPFFICVNYLSFSGITAYLPEKIFPFAMSVLSGYPMGAKIIGDMCRSGRTDIREAKRLVSFCSTSGPVFIIGAVGIGMLGSQKAGIIVALAHYAGAVCNGVVYTAFFRKRGIAVSGNGLQTAAPQGDFADAAVSSFKSLGIILVYIIIFMFIGDFLDEAGVFDLLDSPAALCAARGFLEMTVGCSYITASGLEKIYECVFASAIISWGGLSVIGQSASMLTGTGINAGYIIITKLTHSILAGIIALFMGTLML